METLHNMRKKTSAKSKAKSTAKPTAKPIKEIFLKERRLTVAVGISSDFGKEKVSLGLSENVKESDDPMDLADEIYDTLEAKVKEKFKLLSADDEYEEEDEEEENEEEEDEEEDEEDEEEDDEDDITEDDIKKMKKAELLTLIDEEELDIDVKKFKKVGELRTAVIDELFEDEEEDDDDEEWDDDEWDDED